MRRIGPDRSHKREAEDLARKVNAALVLGTYRRDEQAERALPGAETLRAHLKAYAPTLKPATRVLYEGLIENHLAPFLGTQDLREIKESDLLRFVREKSAQGLAPKTIKNALSLLRRVCSVLVREGSLSSNPAAQIGELMRQVARASAAETGEVDAWTRGEARILLSTARTHEPRFAPLLALLLATGMRKGEALGLEWQDVEFEDRRLNVRRSRGQNGVSTPKSGRGRRIPMTEALALELFDLLGSRRREALARGWRETPATVFVSEAGKPLDPRNTQRVWERVRRRAQKEGVRPFKLHAARHTWASMALQSGKSVRWVADVLGHSDPALTLRVYAHAMREEEADLSFAQFEDGTRRHYAAPGNAESSTEDRNTAEELARREGFEPPTLRFEA
ncbi:MAG: tyrosine-type recombinase/integrase [Myxococcota bacterium]